MPTHEKMMSLPWLNSINWALADCIASRETMTQSEKFPGFEVYLQDLLHRSRTSLSEIENPDAEAALDRCRELVSEIKSILLHKKNHQCIDVSSLADFQVSLERAASVLGQKDGRASHETDKDEA
jgi:hypothetical protein